MQKKKIAVIFGGNSTEYEVSLQSAFSVFENINHDKYDIIPIGITRNGDWYHYKGRYENIANNTWSGDRDCCSYRFGFPNFTRQKRRGWHTSRNV